MWAANNANTLSTKNYKKARSFQAFASLEKAMKIFSCAKREETIRLETEENNLRLISLSSMKVSLIRRFDCRTATMFVFASEMPRCSALERIETQRTSFNETRIEKNVERHRANVWTENSMRSLRFEWTSRVIHIEKYLGWEVFNEQNDEVQLGKSTMKWSFLFLWEQSNQSDVYVNSISQRKGKQRRAIELLASMLGFVYFS